MAELGEEADVNPTLVEEDFVEAWDRGNGDKDRFVDLAERDEERSELYFDVEFHGFLVFMAEKR